MLKTGEARYKEELELLDAYQAELEAGIPLRRTDLEPIYELPLLSSKPIMYVANVEEGSQELHPALVVRAEEEGAEVIAVSAAFEMELSQLEPEEAEFFLADAGMEKPALHRLVEAGLRLFGFDHLLHESKARRRVPGSSPGGPWPHRQRQDPHRYGKGFYPG